MKAERSVSFPKRSSHSRTSRTSGVRSMPRVGAPRLRHALDLHPGASSVRWHGVRFHGTPFYTRSASEGPDRCSTRHAWRIRPKPNRSLGANRLEVMAGAMAVAGLAPVTAIIGSHNEASLLQRCLPSVAFCEEVIVIDIDSRDRTAAVAEEHGARVLRHAWVPIAERARLELIGEAKRELGCSSSTRTRCSRQALAKQITDLLPSLEADVGVVDCPWQFYFRGRSLQGTIWGGITRKRTLARRGGADLRPTVHFRDAVAAGVPGPRSPVLRRRRDRSLLGIRVSGTDRQALALPETRRPRPLRPRHDHRLPGHSSYAMAEVLRELRRAARLPRRRDRPRAQRSLVRVFNRRQVGALP